MNYHVSFRINHPSINPDEMCKELQLEPEFKWKAGEQRKSPKGKPLPGIYEESYCCFELKNDNGVGLTDFLKSCNRKLYLHKDYLNTIRSSGGRLEFFVGWFVNENNGEYFDLDLLKQLTELGITLAISVYK